MNGERGVSPVFGYVLTLGISTLLVSGLLIAAGGFVEDQREQTSRSELRVIGQQVSADIAAADRLHRTDGASEIAITRTIPEQVVGSQYKVAVRTDSNGPTVPYLELTATRPEVTVEIGVASETAVAESTVSGGEIVVEYESGPDELEVSNA
ncbi:DUF7266 family protein [Natronomonas marina]|jgi:hypothetical protein|uniref:DUF7266 family protein n=1 Tax=Natronomonas marina TaxID=2961939 RepID=UPI0020C9DF4D|nr:hypothetical protein [Natronomonas marina]